MSQNVGLKVDYYRRNELINVILEEHFCQESDFGVDEGSVLELIEGCQYSIAI